MEIFSLGNLSKTVGKMLTDMSSLYDVGRRRRSAGLLLVDRTLDLLTPCCHGDSLVDRVFSSLPRRENTASYTHIKTSQSQLKQGPSNLERASLDVQIPLAKILSEEDCKIDNFRLLESIEAFLCGWDSGNSASQILDLSNLKNKIQNEKPSLLEIELLRGSLISTESFRGTPYLEALLDRKTKDGTILVKKWLQEALRRENISVNVKSRPVAALAALDESHSSRWEAFSSAEKILSVSAEDTSQSLAVQIGDFINKSAFLGLHGQKTGKFGASQGVLSFQDALPSYDFWIYISWVDNLFKFLHKLSSLKSRNIPLRDGALDSENNFGGDPYASRGLLYKLLTRVLGKNDVTGLEYHSSTVGQLFKSGFRRFGLGQAKPSLADQNVILVFVIGGINGVEVREAQEALSESGRPDIELILGGTTLLTPDDMLELLLGKSSYF
ncbi:hypothetical protein M0R45_002718 [Rubus argutus]|uniref:Sec1 family domain-containing protein MIP3 n=1 Tax=Rubus argutus TaxID=59490 RepID=A0AAW1VRB5_RUBAR